LGLITRKKFLVRRVVDVVLIERSQMNDEPLARERNFLSEGVRFGLSQK
jgi:hypothetical protein